MFRNLSLKPVYISDIDDISKCFTIPVLKNATNYDRTSAYFSAGALALCGEGLEYFGNNGNHYRLIISKDISQEDYEQIKKGYSMKKESAITDVIVDSLLDDLNEELSLKQEMHISNLAYFIAKGILEIKIAFKDKGIFHDKCGIATDVIGDSICFRGSNNETRAALKDNYESFQLMCSWLGATEFYERGINDSKAEFELLWNNKKTDLIILPAADVILKEIIKHNKGKVIVEEVLLMEEAVILDFDGQLILQVNTNEIDWLLNKAFFKTRIKHKIERIDGNTLFFNTELTYTDYLKIDKVLAEKIPTCGYKYLCTQRLKNRINERNLYIEKRANLGTELKTDASKLDTKFLRFKEIVDNELSRKLRDKQMQDAFFMYAMSKSCNFSVPGSGKTSSAIAVYAFLRYSKLVDKIVMIGPKNAFGSWIDEFKACFGDKLPLNYFNIQDPKYHSLNEKKKALKLDVANCNLLLFNYESLAGYIDEVRHIVSSRTLLVFDEVHRVKKIDGQRAVNALAVAQESAYTIAMTGTPIPNSYLDIYNLLHILFNEEYKDFFGFDISMLSDPSPADIYTINKKLQPFFCRTTKKELLVPEANEDININVDVTIAEQKLFEIVRKKYNRNKLALFIRLLQLESNPQMLLQNLDLSVFSDVLDTDCEVEEIDFVDYSSDVYSLIESINISSKKKYCISLIKKLVEEGKKVIVWCIFKESITSLCTLLNSAGIESRYIMGEVELEDRERLVSEFKNGIFDVLITNPHTLAESVSLHSVCHDAVYFEYSYNLVHLLQSKDRIHRLGLPDDQYTQYYYMQDRFVLKGEDYSFDEKVHERLAEKERVMLEAIDNQILEPTTTPEEDIDIIFNGLL